MPSSSPDRGRWRMLAAVAGAQFLGMTLWFSATAVTPALVQTFQMTDSQAAWLTTAVQAGFVVGTLASAAVNIADLVNARLLVCLGASLGAIFNASVLLAPNASAVIGLRFLTGVALASVYPPAMKIAAGWFKDRRGFALGLLIAALTLGKAFPHLLTSWFGAEWRAPMMLTSALALAGGVLVLALVEDGPYVSPTSAFDPQALRRILRQRGVRLAMLGYLGHMWELYAMWTWVGVLATASFAASGMAGAAGAGSLAAFCAIGSGALGCGLAGYAADRLGKARIAIWSMWASAACAVATVAAFGGSPAVMFGLVMVWGFAVVADSAQFSAIISEHAPPELIGTALTLQTSAGFLVTMVTIEAMPRLAAAVGWQWASLLLVPGPVLGALALRGLAGVNEERATASPAAAG